MRQALHFVYYLGWFYYYSQPLGFAGWFLHITDKFFLLIFPWHHLMILLFVLHFTPFVGRCIRHRFDYGAIILLGNCFELFVHVVPSIYLRSSCFLKFELIFTFHIFVNPTLFSLIEMLKSLVNEIIMPHFIGKQMSAFKRKGIELIFLSG